MGCNIATIGALYKAFGKKTTIIYLGTIIVFSIIFGLLFDAILQKTDISTLSPHEHHAWWMEISAYALAALMAYLALDKIKAWSQRGSNSPNALVVSVGGMTCNGCVKKLQSQLATRSGIEHVILNLEPGQAIVDGTIREEELRRAIVEIGFEAL